MIMKIQTNGNQYYLGYAEWVENYKEIGLYQIGNRQQREGERGGGRGKYTAIILWWIFSCVRLVESSVDIAWNYV